MKALIVSGGRIDFDFALSYLRENSFDYTIAVDGALSFLNEIKLVPTHIVGDFDTVSHKLLDLYREMKTEIRSFNPEKDATDTQLAIELALELECSDIVILGGTGSRLDHVLGNIQSLMLPRRTGASCVLLDAHNRIRLVGEETVIRREEQFGRYVSLIPLTTEVTGVTLQGFKYPLHDFTFTSTGSAGLGVSNEITGSEARICLKSGILVMIESRD